MCVCQCTGMREWDRVGYTCVRMCLRIYDIFLSWLIMLLFVYIACFFFSLTTSSNTNNTK